MPEEQAKVAAIYKQHIGQKMQAQVQPIREAIVVIKEDTTMEQLQNLVHSLQRSFVGCVAIDAPTTVINFFNRQNLSINSCYST